MSQMQPIPSPVLHAAAEELERLSYMTEALGTRLCQDSEMAERHLEVLQNIDLISQSLSQISKVVRAQDAEAAIDEVELEQLQAQFRGPSTGSFSEFAS